MNATKRKFNTLLQGIGTKSTTSVPSKEPSSNDADSQSKKRRVLPPKTTPRTTVTGTGNSNGSGIGHQKSLSTATPALSEEPPKYAPWDRTAFLKRLKSFSNLTDWTPKPARVNEVEWAKRGWVCQKQERVRCCLCNVEIVVKLNKKEVEGKEEPVYIAGNIEVALVEKYVELIVTSHNEDCMWRKRGCDDSIFKLPLSNTVITLQDLWSRYDELCLRKDTLPYMFNFRLPPDFDLDLVLSYLQPSFLASNLTDGGVFEDSQPAINKVALQLALFGWQGHKHDRLGNQLGSVSCNACFRVLGLWLFKSKSVNEAGEEIEPALVTCLDTLTEHREYCPWRNSTSQNGLKAAKTSTAEKAGWEVVLQLLKNNYQLRQAANRKEKPRKMVTEADFDENGIFGGEESESEETKSIREEEDKKRWARLRRVKSLFDTKNKSKRSSAIENKGKPGGV